MSKVNCDNPRQEVEEAIATGDLSKLLRMNGMLHGHFCPFSAMGVKAAVRAIKELGVRSTGMEEVVAIVETNNCFSDGIQEYYQLAGDGISIKQEQPDAKRSA